MNLNLQPTPSRQTHVFGSTSSELTSQYSEDTTPLEARQSSAWIGLIELMPTNVQSKSRNSHCKKGLPTYSLS